MNKEYILQQIQKATVKGFVVGLIFGVFFTGLATWRIANLPNLNDYQDIPISIITKN